MKDWDEKIIAVMAIFGLCLVAIVATAWAQKDPYTSLSIGITAIGSLITGVKIGEARKLG